MPRPKKAQKKDTTKACSAKGTVRAKKTATETRPKPRATYNGAIVADHDADERVASAALMMLGYDKTHGDTQPGQPQAQAQASKSGVVKNVAASGVLVIESEDEEEEEEDEIDELDEDGSLTNEVGNLNDDVDGTLAEQNGDDSDASSGTVHYFSLNTNIHLIFSATITPPPSFKALPTFDIEFEVPCGVAVRDVTLRSSDTWTRFVMKISEVMGCSHNALPSLGYVPSWKPAKAKTTPKILDGPEALAKLVKEARDMIAESKAKNRGKGVVKAWSIHLVDLYKAETNLGKVSLLEMDVFVNKLTP